MITFRNSNCNRNRILHYRNLFIILSITDRDQWLIMKHDFVDLKILKITEVLIFVNVIQFWSEFVHDGLNDPELRLRKSGGEEWEEEDESGGEKERGDEEDEFEQVRREE